MPSLNSINKLRGLNASDRTAEEQRAINQQMGYKEEPKEIPIKINTSPYPISPTPASSNIPPGTESASSITLKRMSNYYNQLENQYKNALVEANERFHVGDNSVNQHTNEYIDNIANEVSSYYKRYKNTDKIPEGIDKKRLAAQYDARKATYGEDNANIWLDNYYKNIVANNQSWWEQAWNAVSHLGPAIEGGAIQIAGNIVGMVNPILDTIGLGLDVDNNEAMSWWDNYIDNIMDNPITRYGRDVERAGASNILQGFSNLVGINDETASERIQAMKDSATRYNPEGIGADAIVPTIEQDQSLINATTPWTAIQSGGFTALSMISGNAMAAGSKLFFNSLAKGAKALNSANKIIKTTKTLEKTLEGIKKAQNAYDAFVIPGLVGTTEGMVEGLNTKIEVEQSGIRNLDEYYKDKVEKEALEAFNDDTNNPMIKTHTEQGDIMKREKSFDQVYREVWDKYKDKYAEARDQIDWAASKAGQHNFWANSLINGMMNTTLKAGIMAPRVQETLRNNRFTGWAYRRPKFTVDENGIVTPKNGWAGTVGSLIKEPIGEGTEEYLQSLSGETFSAAAENNINEFIKNKFEGDGTAKVGDSFSSDWVAASTALGNALTDKESIQSAILGAVSSSIGTVSMPSRGYHLDENNRVVSNGIFDYRNLGRGVNADGTQESVGEYLRRVTPWRSGLINAYYDNKRENAEAKEVAATLTEWLKDPQNRAKWDGLTGTANWMTAMQHATENNDQFNYRKAQMGKAINDVMMLSKLKGTSIYDTVLNDLQRSSEMTVDSEEGQSVVAKMRNASPESYEGVSDEEIISQVNDNANKMLGLLSSVEKEGRALDRLIGRVDEDTKQSLIYGRLMEQNHSDRKVKLEEEIQDIQSKIKSSRGSGVTLDDDLKSLIVRYGSLGEALHERQRLQDQKVKAEDKVKTLEAIDKNKRSDNQNKELDAKKQEIKKLDGQLQTFDGLYKKDDKGRKTDEIDTSLANLVLNEEEIMRLDPRTRAVMMLHGTAKFYNAIHQNREKVDNLNAEIDRTQREIDALQRQNEGWTDGNGNVKKHHNKQVERNNKKIAELETHKKAKMRELDNERGNNATRPVYSEAQQKVIDNLVQQGTAIDNDFVDKVVDVGRLDKAIQDYHTQYQAILSDPNAFHNYVRRAKASAAMNLVRRRAERVANIQDYSQYAKEVNQLYANASEAEKMIITQTLAQNSNKQRADIRRQKNEELIQTVADKQAEGSLITDDNGDVAVVGNAVKEEDIETNYDRFNKELKKQNSILQSIGMNEELTDNDKSMLAYAVQYLSQNGIDVETQDAIDALLEKDEAGNLGGKFRQYVEEMNAAIPEQQRAFMPVFTSIGQIVNDYFDILNNQKKDRINKSIMNPVVADPQTVTVTPQPVNTPQNTSVSNTQSAAPSIFTTVGGSTPEEGAMKNGGVTTDATLNAAAQRQAETDKANTPKSEIVQAFEVITTPEIASNLKNAEDIINNATANVGSYTDENKASAIQSLKDIAVNLSSEGSKIDTIDELLEALAEGINKLGNEGKVHEASLLKKVSASIKNTQNKGKMRGPVNTNSTVIQTANINYLRGVAPESWPVRFYEGHRIEEYNRNNVIDLETPIYFLTDSEWARESSNNMDGYTTNNNMPIVTAVEVKDATPTTIEIDGKFYQPIGILPSGTSQVSGAERTNPIRRFASKNAGTHLVTVDGTSEGKPLVSKVNGLNYRVAQHPDAKNQRNNSQETNRNVLELLTSSGTTVDEFLDRVSWGEEFTGNKEFLNDNPVYTPDDLKGNQGRSNDWPASSSKIHRKDPKDTLSSDGKTTLEEVLENGTPQQVVNFNSITQGLYNELINNVFGNPLLEASASEEGAEILTRQLQGYNGTKESQGIKGVNEYLYIKPRSGWSLTVSPNKDGNSYNIYLTNSDNVKGSHKIGTIEANLQERQDNNNAANTAEFIRNLLWDSASQEVRDFILWQLSKSDIEGLNSDNPDRKEITRKKITAMINDGIFEIPATSLHYQGEGILIKAPYKSNDDTPVYNIEEFANKHNATPAGPINRTPLADGSVVTNNGVQVEPKTGAVLDNAPKTPKAQVTKTQEELEAEELVKKITDDASDFVLSEDESFYVRKSNPDDRHARVTTLIGAVEDVVPSFPSADSLASALGIQNGLSKELTDEIDRIINLLAQKNITNSRSAIKQVIKSMSQQYNIPVETIESAVRNLKFDGWSTPSTAIGNTADTITRDFFNGDLNAKYPNVSDEVLKHFVGQLNDFKTNLESEGITIISKDVVAHGELTVTDEDGVEHKIKVAGTLDLFGYDKKGNFYIFDMKTVRNLTPQKLEDKKAKWSRQVSLYRELLKQTYGIDIKDENLRIIPINVSYPVPKGTKPGMSRYGMTYTVDNEGQLSAKGFSRDSQEFNIEDPKDFSMNFIDTKQFQAGRRELKIVFDYLDSNYQAISEELKVQSPSTDVAPIVPKTGQVETPEPSTSSALEATGVNINNSATIIEEAPSIEEAGAVIEALPEWDNLSEEQKEFIQNNMGYATKKKYNKDIKDIDIAATIVQKLKCAGLM